MWHAHLRWVSGTNLGSHELPQHHHHPIHQNNVSKFHYTSITILHIKLPDTQVSQYYISSQLPIMLPVNQLCSWLPIMLLAINYAQNYASIIGKALLGTRDKVNKSGTVPEIPGQLEPMDMMQPHWNPVSPHFHPINTLSLYCCQHYGFRSYKTGIKYFPYR